MPHAIVHSSPSPSAEAAGEKQHRWLARGGILLLVLACAYPFTLNFVDADLWGHVRYGQDWLAAGEMPRTATHTHTAVGYPWVNHENAAELLFAICYEQTGVYGLLIGKCLLGLSILGMMAWMAHRHGVPASSTWTLLLLVSAGIEPFFLMRPQLLSFGLCALALVCLDRGFPQWPEHRTIRGGWLAVLPVIFIAWVNSHGGFVAGLCIVGTLLLGRIIELLVHDGRRGLGRASFVAVIGLACLAATAINPYGLGMHQWLWDAWGGAPPEITEWGAPSPGDPVFWRFAVLVAVAVICLAATQRPRDWVQIVILALVAWQAARHQRHIVFVALLVGFWLPIHWHSVRLRIRGARENHAPSWLSSPWLRGVAATGILLGLIAESAVLARRLGDMPVVRTEFPVDAVQFMADNDLKGRALVSFNWAQYAIAALAPDVTVGFDGRFDTCYPQEAIDVHFDFLLGDAFPRERSPEAGPIDRKRALEYGSPDLVLFSRGYEPCANLMRREAARENPEWALLYSDSIAELWGRRSRFDDPTSPDYLAPDKRCFDVELSETTVQWPALPEKNSSNGLPQQFTTPRRESDVDSAARHQTDNHNRIVID